MHSEPRQIASGTIGTDGTFSQRILLPADTAAGEAHSISVNGTGLNGAAISDTAWFSVGFDGAIEAVSDTGPVADPVAPVADPVASATLPLTGTNAMTLLFWALAWLMAGFIFVGESKRRRNPLAR